MATPESPPAASPLTVDCWVRQLYAKHGVSDVWATPRYAACRLLKEKGIACLVWFEDALAYYGVDTVCFDVHIIVNDVDAAQAALTAAGEWVSLAPAPQSQFLCDIQSQLRFLRQRPDNDDDDDKAAPSPTVPDNRAATQVLMPAALWRGAIVLPDVAASPYQQPRAADRWPFMPPLPDLLNGLLAQWLDAQPAEQPVLRLYHAMLIAAVVGQVRVVRGGGGDGGGDAEFVARVAPENRQLLLDVLAGIDLGPPATHAHERAVREAIRAGTHALQACSVARDDERYFTPAQKRRIAARQQQQLRREERESGERDEVGGSDDPNEQQRSADIEAEGLFSGG
jgi:hypothetical protein